MEKSMPGFLSFSKKGGYEYGFICFSTWLPKTEFSQGKVHKKFDLCGRLPCSDAHCYNTHTLAFYEAC